MYRMKHYKNSSFFKVQIQEILMVSLIHKTFKIEMEFDVEMPN